MFYNIESLCEENNTPQTIYIVNRVSFRRLPQNGTFLSLFNNEMLLYMSDTFIKIIQFVLEYRDIVKTSNP